MDSVKYIGNAADANSGIYHINEVNAGIKDGSWPTNYKIENSLRFDGTSSYLSRTPTTAGNRQTWTWSGWVKRSDFDIQQTIFSATDSGNAERIILYLLSSNDISFSGTSQTVRSNSVLRDTSSWYHIVFIFDVTEASASDRVKIYINGIIQSTTSTGSFDLNKAYNVNNTVSQGIGIRIENSDRYFEGYLANIHFIDGQALDPSYFATTHPVTGRWVPKPYRGTYGTNGFHLDFSNKNSGTGVGTIGEDKSGNGNHWTTNNLDHSDVVLDSPTNNFNTINTLHAMPGRTDFATLLDGSLTINTGTTSPSPMFSTFKIPNTGKWYWEIYLGGSYAGIFSGIKDTEDKSGVTYYQSLYYHYNSAGSATTTATPNNTTVGAVHGYFVDFDNGIFRAYMNGTPQGDISMLEKFGDVLYSRDYLAYFADGSSANSTTQTVNFGQDPTFAGAKVPSKVYTDSNNQGSFFYQPPEGALALCEANLNQPEITPNQYPIDETNQHRLTYNGNVQQSKFTPYATDGYSINFDGSSRLYDTSNANYNIGTSDYSIECWIYFTDITNAAFFQTETDLANSSGRLWFGYLSGELTASIHGSGTYWVGTVWNPTRYKWYHVAAKRESGIVSIYIDGVNQTISGTNPNTIQNGVSISQNGISVGVRSGGSGTFFKGYITDLKFNIGGISSTVGTIPTSVISDVNTKLLLKNENNSFKDSSSLNNTLTIGGSPEISDWSPYTPELVRKGVHFRRPEDYGGGSFYFDGNGDYLTANIDGGTGSGDFTIEMWVYNTNLHNYVTWFGNTRGGTGFNIGTDVNGAVVWYSNSARQIDYAAGLKNNAWYHIAFERLNGVITLYLNGVSVATYNSSTDYSDSTFELSRGTISGEEHEGYISDFRFVKGSAVYQGNFTPPTAKLSTVTDTKLLLQPWQTATTRGVFTTPDTYKQEETGKSLTYVGTTNITQSSPYKNINIGSIESSTNNNSYISLENNTDFNFGTGPFTMETWIKRSGDTSSTRMIFNRSDRSGNNMNNNEYAWFITGTEMQVHYPGVVAISGGSDLSNVNNTDWMHVVWERVDTNAGGVHFYVNGVKTSSHQYSFNLDSTRNFEIGGASTSGRGVGFYSDIRIVKGQALYGGTNFIPPAYPLSSTHYTTNGQDPSDSNSTRTAITGTVSLLAQPGTGFTKNSAAQNPKKYFNTLLYSGTGQKQSITGLNFQPDLVWIKKRSDTASNMITDSNIGPNVRLRTDTTGQKQEQFMLSSFDDNGFTLNDLNTATGTAINSVDTFVAWCWKAGGAASGDGVAMVDGVEKTITGDSKLDAGTITPTRMSVNTKAGFSIVSFIGDGSNTATVGHGLNSTPELTIIKDIDALDDWQVKYIPSNFYLKLNGAGGAETSYPNYTATSSVINLGYSWNNDPNNNHIAYCWHSVEGYSKFGSFTGNGSPDGPFVYCGFRPAWVMYKRTDTTGNWAILDNKRNLYNVVNNRLFADESWVESDLFGAADFTSNGFKIRTDAGSTNATNATYIFMAFAEQPFTKTTAR